MRPFNTREKEANSVSIISMDAANTYIQNPDTPDKPPAKFGFDHSYWSHDGFIEPDHKDGYLHPQPGTRYVD